MTTAEHGGGPRIEVAPSSGTATRTITGTVRPVRDSQSTSTQSSTVAFRQAAWSRLWDRLLEEPERAAA
jgi:hypothetical protein